MCMKCVSARISIFCIQLQRKGVVSGDSVVFLLLLFVFLLTGVNLTGVVVGGGAVLCVYFFLFAGVHFCHLTDLLVDWLYQTYNIHIA